MTRLDPQSMTRLIKLLGLCGSAFAGERSVAALKADQLVRDCGLTWHDVVHAPPGGWRATGSMRDWHNKRNFCLRHAALLSEREQEFLVSLGRWRGVSLRNNTTGWLQSSRAYSAKQREDFAATPRQRTRGAYSPQHQMKGVSHV